MVGVWTFAFYPNMAPFQPWIQIIALPMAFLLWDHLFKSDAFEIQFDKTDAQVFLAILGTLVLFQLPWLNLSLSNDEPHHLERALFPLKALTQLLAQWAPLTEASARESLWLAMDPRVLPAADLWRLLGPICLAFFIGLIWILNRLRIISSIPTQWIATLLTFALVGWIGHSLQGWLDNHPPLRTLPMFVTTSVFGLNDFGVRVAGPLVLAFAGLLWSKIWFADRDFFKLLVPTLLICFIPSVFYSTVVAESSLFGFIGWTSILMAVTYSYRKSSPVGIKTALILLPIFVLMRHSTLFLSPLIALAMLDWTLRRGIHWTYWLRSLSSWLLMLPFLWTLFQLGNGTVQNSASALDQTLDILIDGHSFGSVIFNHFPLWILGFVFCFAFAAIKDKSARWVLLFFPVAYFLFHFPLMKTTWSIGRYHAEFFASFFALAILIGTDILKPSLKKLPVVLFLVVALFSSRQTLELAQLDTFVPGTDSQRLINTTNLPFGQAIQSFKKNEQGTQFVFVGGVPTEFESLLWLNGYNLIDSRNWYNVQSQVSQGINQGVPFRQILAFLKSQGIKTLVTQEGSRREKNSRSPGLNNFYQQMNQELAAGTTLKESYQFTSPGGSLKVYKLLD